MWRMFIILGRSKAKQICFFIEISSLVSDPVLKEQCRMLSNVTASPTPITGTMSVGVGE